MKLYYFEVGQSIAKFYSLSTFPRKMRHPVRSFKRSSGEAGKERKKERRKGRKEREKKGKKEVYNSCSSTGIRTAGTSGDVGVGVGGCGWLWPRGRRGTSGGSRASPGSSEPRVGRPRAGCVRAVSRWPSTVQAGVGEVGGDGREGIRGRLTADPPLPVPVMSCARLTADSRPVALSTLHTLSSLSSLHRTATTSDPWTPTCGGCLDTWQPSVLNAGSFSTGSPFNTTSLTGVAFNGGTFNGGTGTFNGRSYNAGSSVSDDDDEDDDDDLEDVDDDEEEDEDEDDEDVVPSGPLGDKGLAGKGATSTAAPSKDEKDQLPMIDMSAYEDYLKPIYKDGDVVLEVECGKNHALLYLSRLCQGSKGPCIFFNDMWLTPNEFQFVSGRETAKDWKRSIRHHGKSMKLLLSKGILAVHPPICDCDGCRISSPVNRGRLAEKRAFYPPYLDVTNGPSPHGKRTSSIFNPLQSPMLQEISSPINSHVQKSTSSSKTSPSCIATLTAPPTPVVAAQSSINWTRNMESTLKRKSESSLKSPDPVEKKRESRLTSIIDQLLNNKTKGLNRENIKSAAPLQSIINHQSTASAAPPPSSVAESETNSKIGGKKSQRLDTTRVTSTAAVAVKQETKATPITTLLKEEVPLPATTTTTTTTTTAHHQKRSNKDLKRNRCSGRALGKATTEWQVVCDQLPLAALSTTVHESSSGACTTTSNCRAAFIAAPLGMPTDQRLIVDPSKIKSERLSPNCSAATNSNSSSSSSSSTSSSLGLGLGGFAFPALAVDTSSPGAGCRRARTSASAAATSPAFPGSAPHTPTSPSPILHDRFSPTATTTNTTSTTPILKQMEQMMTRNYSDFMRSLAAKYNNNNNNNPAECYTYPPHLNGLMRNFDGRFPFKTTTPPLIGLARDESNRKSENHSAPPALGSVGALSPLSPLGAVVDLSSTQALLSMVRSASAQSASQLENYLKGVLKRPLEPEGNSNSGTTTTTATAARADPLDLSVASKRPRMCESDLPNSLKTDSDASDVSPTMSPRSNGSGSESRAWPGLLLDGKLSALEQQPSRRSGLSMTKNLPCVSLCSERACVDGSQAAIVANWTVQQVCEFVASIDACAEYVSSFREQAIDGAALPLLSEDHLVNNMNLKLGPALKLRAILAKKIGNCAVCMHCIHCHGLTSSSDTTTSPITSSDNGKMTQVS